MQLGLSPEFDLPAPEDRRTDGDFWPTPPWLARAGLQAIPAWPGGRLLDAGCGLGVLGIEAEHIARQRPGRVQVTAVEGCAERLERCPAHWRRVRTDFFAWGQDRLGREEFDLVVTNPPLRLTGRENVWIDWVSLCLGLTAAIGGCCLALGHDLLWTSRARQVWWQEHPAAWWLPSPRRPSFTADGQTDGRVWGWWMWLPGAPGAMATQTRLLEVEW